MATKVFESAPREAAPQSASALTPLPFTLPGDAHRYTAHPPKEAVWQQVSLAGRANAPVNRRVQVLLNYLRGTLADPEDAERLEDRLLNAADSLDLIDLFPVINHLSAVWTAQAKAAGGGRLTAAETALLAEVLDAGERTVDGEVDGEVTDEVTAAAPVRKRRPAA